MGINGWIAANSQKTSGNCSLFTSNSGSPFEISGTKPSDSLSCHHIWYKKRQSRFCSCRLLHLRPWSFLFQVVSASGVSLRKCNKKPLGTLWRGSRHGVRNTLWLSGLDEQIRLMRVIGALWRKGPTIMIVVKGSDNDNANSSFKWAFFHNPAASTALTMATKKGTNIFEPWSRI